MTMPASRTAFVLEAITSSILGGRLRPGQPLVETELAASLGVSKTPVREALKTLHNSGLVVTTEYRGVSVRIADAAMVRQVSDVRMVLEPEALRRGVERGSDFGAAADALDTAPAGGNAEAQARSNRDFHGALYRSCGNPLMVAILDGLRDQTALISITGWGVSPTWDEEAGEHRAILTAAQAGEAERAAGLLRTHIEGFRDRVLARLPGGA
ncbi:GntR family transcriptional regulator [Pseudonocardia sp. MH-G8]|uniref:GntR family transcriptional regulator n=1 Tax=Pseudonocardia sp. MH-G8 TaxID=1854588 RepID=UPI000BA16536|nr:GntR family transcriptional regulator [Pseudonocardia sp. MH-G8]OZM76099.1 GntR family transcriptional regulator [Pseudonocardia sp. MH-G8]